VVVGGGQVALRKVAWLRRAGAHVTVVAPRLHPQLGEQAEPVGRVGVAVGRIRDDAEAAALGLVHRDVGALQQRADGRAVLRIQRHADARLQLDGYAAQADRLAQRVLQAAGQLGDGAAVG